MHKRLHHGQGFQYKVSWREAGGHTAPWSHSNVRSPPFVVNGTGTYTPFEIKVQAINSVGDAPEPEPEIGHSGEDGTCPVQSEMEEHFIKLQLNKHTKIES